MRFDTYLIEKKGRSKPILQNKLEQLLNDNCSDAMKSTPIYRGLKDTSKPFLIVNPSKTVRKSANVKSNIYMLLMSNLPSWSKYPPRNRSIACSTSTEYAGHYGTYKEKTDTHLYYRVYPYDGAKIGVASSYDIWQSFETGFGKTFFLRMFNETMDTVFKQYLGYIAGKNVTYENLLKMIDETDGYIKQKQKRYKSDGFNVETYFYYENKYFFQKIGYLAKTDNQKLTGKRLFDCIENALNPGKNGFHVVTVGNKLPKDREVWTDSPCLLVRNDYEIK